MTMNETTPIVTPDEIVMGTPTAIESMRRAEVDSQVAIAKRFPRNNDMVRKEIHREVTYDQETAEACFYSLPRAGKTITGASVRMAEIARQAYGNVSVGFRTLAVVADGANPHVIVQAVAYDKEKNAEITIEKRRRITKKRNKDSVDEDDINLATNACAAIAKRDAIFEIIPRTWIKSALDAAKKVAVGDMKSLVSRRNKMVDSFSKMGITPDRILAVLEKPSMDEVDLSDMETLVGLYTAIKDGQTSVEEAFPLIQKAPKRPVSDDQIPGAEVKQPDNVVAIASAETPFPELIKTLDDLMTKDSVSHEKLMAWAVKTKLAKPNQQIDDLATAKLRTIINTWKVILPDIQKQPKE